MAVYAPDPPGANPNPTIREQAAIGRAAFPSIMGVQLALILLAAPAATAGSICIDKARGMLSHVLVTDLSSAEVVPGKLAARLVTVLGLVACTLPQPRPVVEPPRP